MGERLVARSEKGTYNIFLNELKLTVTTIIVFVQQLQEFFGVRLC